MFLEMPDQALHISVVYSGCICALPAENKVSVSCLCSHKGPSLQILCARFSGMAKNVSESGLKLTVEPVVALINFSS